MFKAFEIGGLRQGRVEKAVGGHVRRLPYGAPPHGGLRSRYRPIVMSGRRGEHPRGDPVPDEPTREDLMDERAKRATVRSIDGTGSAGHSTGTKRFRI